jgi:hypothetical protein
MELKFFTQRIWMCSPTYWKIFKGKWETKDQEKPIVKMTADISVDDNYGDNHLLFHIVNRMWDDPTGKKDKEVSVSFVLTHEQIIYLHSFLEAFLKTVKPT